MRWERIIPTQRKSALFANIKSADTSGIQATGADRIAWHLECGAKWMAAGACGAVLALGAILQREAGPVMAAASGLLS
jgi:hypothetical protein